MVSTKTLVIGAFLTCLSVFFQTTPAIFSETFVFITTLSALPIYLIAKINPKIGVSGYLAAAILIMLLSVHESLFFLCTNGSLGLSLGICHYYTNKKFLIFIISSIILTITLSIMNFIIGIPVFGMKISDSNFIQLSVLIIFSFLYTIFYFFIASFSLKFLTKRYKFQIK